jgi:hypothetical protein
MRNTTALWDDNGSYTGPATGLDKEIHDALAPIFKKAVSAGCVHPRHLAALAHATVEEAICEIVLDRKSEDCKVSG